MVSVASLNTMLAVIVSLGLVQPIHGFFLPGASSQSFAPGDTVKLKVNKMTSEQTLLPIDFYQMPFCRPDKLIEENENLGELLSGDRIDNSPYVLKMKQDSYCQQLCSTNLGKAPTKGSANRLTKLIRRQYHNNWIVDNLPSASILENDEDSDTRFWQGFPVGFMTDANEAYLHNHVNIKILYHPVAEEDDKYRVVQFIVEPFSIKHNVDDSLTSQITTDDDAEKTIRNPIESCVPGSTAHTSYAMVTASGSASQPAHGPALFTYDVIWEQSDITWASRWDVYLNMANMVPASIHWLSIANSLVVVIVLSVMVVAILVRNLKLDLARYNTIPTDEEKADEMEEKGWKLVHADVFRPPTFSPLLLSACCGTGAQLLCMTFWTIVFSALGFLNPSKRGSLLMAELLFYVLLGTVAGYVSSRLYKTFKGKSWQKATLCTAFAFPGLCFSMFFVMDIMAWSYGSSDAVPFTTMLVLLFLWFGISTPLVFLGAYFGYKQDAFEFPVKTSSIPRQIPDQPWFMGAPFTMLIGGILPFGACFVEMYYILSSIWMELYYYVFGFLLLVFLILIITCAEINLLFNYFQLCNEDYHWWWRSFGTAGASAIWVFLYSIVYFQNLHSSSFSSYVLYFGYMALSSFALFLMTGFVGVVSALWFNKAIFGSLKVD